MLRFILRRLLWHQVLLTSTSHYNIFLPALKATCLWPGDWSFENSVSDLGTCPLGVVSAVTWFDTGKWLVTALKLWSASVFSSVLGCVTFREGKLFWFWNRKLNQKLTANTRQHFKTKNNKNLINWLQSTNTSKNYKQSFSYPKTNLHVNSW